jgi:hypothetical protein
MKIYKCGYRKDTSENLKSAEDVEIEASSFRQAYQEFIDLSKQVNDEQVVKVEDEEYFFEKYFYPPHITTKERDKIKKEEENKEFKKETEKYSNMTKDELLLKMIQLQNKQINLFENQIKKQNEQTEALYKIRWAIVALLIFIVGQTIVLKMKLGL